MHQLSHDFVHILLLPYASEHPYLWKHWIQLHVDSLPVLHFVYFPIDSQTHVVIILHFFCLLALFSPISRLLLVFFEFELFFLLFLEFYHEGASDLAKARLDEKGGVKCAFEASQLKLIIVISLHQLRVTFIARCQ